MRIGCVVSLLSALVLSSVAMAEVKRTESSGGLATTLPGNAHWECWCICLGTGHGPVVFEFAGKCDGTENGSGCVVKDDAGTLDMCVTVAEQDD